MNEKLSAEEWNKLQEILKKLMDITWEYSELYANRELKIYEENQPKRLVNEPYKNYNQRLVNWDKDKTESYTRTFHEVKQRSFNLVSELERILIKLGLPNKAK